MAQVESNPELHVNDGNDFLSPDTLSSLDEYAANSRFLELQEELRSTLFTGLTGSPTSGYVSRAASEPVEALPSSVTNQSLDLSQVSISTKRVVAYLTNWITDCAPYLDKFDEQQHFGVQALVIAQSYPALLYAILAFSARQIERKTGVNVSHDSLELYQESIRLLNPLLQAKDPIVLVPVCILACLELMSVSPRDWRWHVQGCAALFQSFGVTGFSGGLVQAVFWCYARMDLCGAIMSNGADSTALPIGRWIPQADEADSSKKYSEEMIKHLFLQKGRLNPDMHANWAVYLCAKTCDLVYKRTQHLELGKSDEGDSRPFVDKWKAIWNELHVWVTERPPEMRPIELTATCDEMNFPEIFFTHWPAISGNQLYHTACILLLEIKPMDFLPEPDTPQFSTIWHAKRVCGISITNLHSGSRINAIQPLYVAGKLLSHRSEHIIIGKLIKTIEATTGWGAMWRLRDLERYWGYEPGEIASIV